MAHDFQVPCNVFQVPHYALVKFAVKFPYSMDIAVSFFHVLGLSFHVISYLRDTVNANPGSDVFLIPNSTMCILIH